MFVRRPINEKTEFLKIKSGQIFKYGDNYYMRIEGLPEETNSVGMESGIKARFRGCTEVVHMKNSELIVAR